jgi:NTE family protein
MSAIRRASPRRHLTLALQGGGSHGAYTWGVLDRLVEEESLVIEAVSGTSAGAMNAALLVDGLARGGAAGAQRALRSFWESVSRAGDGVFNPWRYVGSWPALRDLASAWSDALARLWSPYDNLAYRNPLAELIEPAIDWEGLRRTRKPRLYVCATDVLTNKRHVFSGNRLSVDALLASACLPTLFQAVQIGAGAYWDGGYTGNPALGPLLKSADDLLIVEVNALRRAQVPTRAAEIAGRLNEVAFNSAMVQEIHTIDTMNKLIARKVLSDPSYRLIRFHAIEADAAMTALDSSTKSTTDLDFLLFLHGRGRQAADAWLTDPQRYGKVGRASSIDVDARYCEVARGNEKKAAAA